MTNIIDQFQQSIVLIALTTALATCTITSTDAADFKDGFGDEVVLEGTIVAGDYEKLRNFIGESLSTSIYLASPGGSVTEALKIGRLVRALKLYTIIPTRETEELEEKLAQRHRLVNPRANYLCASACFFVFVGGVSRSEDLLGLGPSLGIHRPYLTDSELKTLSGNEAMASAAQLKTIVENYLKEMGVPAKYGDLMYAVSKDEISWIDRKDFESDFEGIIPELRDWVEARCDTRSDVEKAEWSALKDKTPADETAAERSMSEALLKKMAAIDSCGFKEISDLSHQAHIKMFAGSTQPQELDEATKKLIKEYVEAHPLTQNRDYWWQFWKWLR